MRQLVSGPMRNDEAAGVWLRLDPETTAPLLMAGISTPGWCCLTQVAPTFQSHRVLVSEGPSDAGAKPGTSRVSGLPSSGQL